MAQRARYLCPTLHWLASSQGAFGSTWFLIKLDLELKLKWKNHTPKNSFVDQNSSISFQPLYSVSGFGSFFECGGFIVKFVEPMF